MKVGFDVRCDIVLKKRRSPRQVTEYVIRVPPKDCERVLEGLGILIDGGYETHRPPALAVMKAQGRRAYLRGSFLGAGSVANPEKAHHLEVRLGTEGSAMALREVLAREGITPGFRAKNGGWLVYLKECEPIVAFLTLIGSHGAVLRYQSVRVLRDVKSRVNRVVNCETANVSRIVETGLRQLEEILFIDKTVGLDSLSPGLRELAQLRMRHPEMSLSELGLLLEPAIGKSGVNHRLRRLSALATELKAGKALAKHNPGDRRQDKGDYRVKSLEGDQGEHSYAREHGDQVRLYGLGHPEGCEDQKRHDR